MRKIIARIKKALVNKRIYVLLLLIAFLWVGFSHAAELSDVEKKAWVGKLLGTDKPYHPKIDTILLVEADRKIRRGVEEKKIKVVIEVKAGETLSLSELAPYGVTVTLYVENILDAYVPAGNLRRLADELPAISYIRPPVKYKPTYTSEGVSLSEATSYHNRGYEGSGVKIAIIDVGFWGVRYAIADGEVAPNAIPKSYLTYPAGEDYEVEDGSVEAGDPIPIDFENSKYAVSPHGSACAEVVYDMAADAQLYLIAVETSAGLLQAKNYCIANGIDIISHSLAWADGPFNGNNSIAGYANDARDNGILWVTAAGNEADGTHWQGYFTQTVAGGLMDTDDLDWWGDYAPDGTTIRFHEFVSGSQVTQASQVTIGSQEAFYGYLLWDDWDTSDKMYAMYLFNIFPVPFSLMALDPAGGFVPDNIVDSAVHVDGATPELVLYYNRKEVLKELQQIVEDLQGVSSYVAAEDGANALVAVDEMIATYPEALYPSLYQYEADGVTRKKANLDQIRIYIVAENWVDADAGLDSLIATYQIKITAHQATDTFYLVVAIIDAAPGEDTYTADEEMELWTTWSACALDDLQYYTAESSIPSPADATGVVTVGAIDQTDWTTGPQETFSSQGPTDAWDGESARVKPDICGPDGVINYMYGLFYGTSASCPHVAGAAALLLDEDSTRTADDLETLLTGRAIDLGTSGKDNIYGWGRLRVPATTPVILTPSAAAGAVERGGTGGKRCFIATAAYGTPMADEVKRLCLFRDKHLLTNEAGRALVKFYYRHSPQAADFIRDKKSLKTIVRAFLRPLIRICKLLDR